MDKALVTVILANFLAFIIFPDKTFSLPYDPSVPKQQVDSLLGPGGLYTRNTYEWGERFPGKILLFFKSESLKKNNILKI